MASTLHQDTPAYRATSPARHSRTLLCVCGLSPQIITETLFALISRDGPELAPRRIVVITTGPGEELIRNELLDPAGPCHLARLLDGFGISGEHDPLEVRDICVIRSRDGQPLQDIRSRADNEAAADLIARTVRQLTGDAAGPLHASIAGGRKTMGFYLGHAMSLFARPRDEVTHVLVNPPFEGHPDFYFPPQEPEMLRVTENGRVRRVRTDAARITLAPIPIVRLRRSLPPELLAPETSYSEAIALAQRSLDPPRLIIDIEQRRASCSGQHFRLPGAQLALLAWMADRMRRARGGVRRSNISDHAGEILHWRSRVTGEHSGSSEGLEQAWRSRSSIDESWFDQTKSRLNSALDKRLGRDLARHYRIEQENGRRNQPFTLALTPDQIEFAQLQDPRQE
ncbi:MAG: TIGR02584 family CRISPR-associated protein [Pseudomonadota bacterium]|nr:MAG: TIGR02584 family CRISPR-associated protein [Pseudomonadota bacterium]